MSNIFDEKYLSSYTQKTVKFIFKSLKKNEILFIILSKNKLENNIFVNMISSSSYKILSNWSFGLISNFYQFCKSFRNKQSYSILSSIDFNSLNYIFLDEIPEKNSSIFKELLLLKKNLNIKIVSLVDINSDPNIIDINFIDFPLYFDSLSVSQTIPDKKALLFYITSQL